MNLITAQCPALVYGKVRIYSMRFCPYAHSVVLVAAAKNIPYDIVYCDLQKKPKFLLEKSPGGIIPVIETPRGLLYESLIVSDYFDEDFMGRVLNRTDAFDKALDRVWVQHSLDVTKLLLEIVSKNKSRTEFMKHLLDLSELLASFEKEIGRRKTKFFGGNDAPGMLDYMMWPWMERLPVIPMKYPRRFDFLNLKRKTPLLVHWGALMKEDEAVKEYILTPEIHLKFLITQAAGKPKYDFFY